MFKGFPMHHLMLPGRRVESYVFFKPARALREWYDGKTVARLLQNFICVCGSRFAGYSDIHVVECLRDGPEKKHRQLIHADAGCRRLARRGGWEVVCDNSPVPLKELFEAVQQRFLSLSPPLELNDEIDDLLAPAVVLHSQSVESDHNERAPQRYVRQHPARSCH